MNADGLLRMLKLFFYALFGKPKRKRRRSVLVRKVRSRTWVRKAQSRTSTASPPNNNAQPRHLPQGEIRGRCYVIDGDTIVIRGTKIRIAGIDAPELDHPWGNKSKFAVIGMCKSKIITAKIQDEASYDRVVAKCYLPDGADIAAELVKQGLALDWAKFSGGEYRQFEPVGIRKKLWRAAAKQQGRLKGFDSNN